MIPVDGNLEFTVNNWFEPITTVLGPEDAFSLSDGQWHEIIGKGLYSVQCTTYR